MWGTWWVWDARLTSELILLFLYLGYHGAARVVRRPRPRRSRQRVLAIVGVVNVPIIHYSVDWWNTLHQAATLTQARQALDARRDALAACSRCSLGFTLYFGAVLLVRLRGEILRRERDASWLQRRCMARADVNSSHMGGYAAYRLACYGARRLPCSAGMVYAARRLHALGARARAAALQRQGSGRDDSAAQAPACRRRDRARASAPRPRSRCTRSRTTCCISTPRRRSLAARRRRGRTFRVGGMVDGGQPQARGRAARGALRRHGLRSTRCRSATAGVLPDLFREGQGVIAHGQLTADGVFVADEVLAKHDENYMPPEVAEVAARRAARRRAECSPDDSASSAISR